MGFYQIGADKLPWGVQCISDGCDARIEPYEPPASTTADVMLAMRRHGWGFDAWAGANLPTCPEHSDPMSIANLENIIIRRNAGRST